MSILIIIDKSFTILQIFYLNIIYISFKVTICCIDPEDYSRLPLTQFEEDNILREMNKSLLGFRQRHVPSSPTDPIKTELDAEGSLGARRLSPIGESFSSTPPEIENENKFYETGDKTKNG